jgi:hypothetical protein
MFLLSRRQVHAAAAGVAAAAAYLGIAEVGSKRPVRVGALFVLASTAMAGLAASGATVQTRAVAVGTRDRFNNLLQNGGTFGGDVVTTGALSAQSTTGNPIQGSFDDVNNDTDSAHASGSVTVANFNGVADRLNNLRGSHNQLNNDVIAMRNRLNPFITALG